MVIKLLPKLFGFLGLVVVISAISGSKHKVTTNRGVAPGGRYMQHSLLPSKGQAELLARSVEEGTAETLHILHKALDLIWSQKKNALQSQSHWEGVRPHPFYDPAQGKRI